MTRRSRKTCPTNRGLRQICKGDKPCASMSEDLPHKSGITTQISVDIPRFFVGRLAPQIGDYDALIPDLIRALYCRKTCPTNRGLRPTMGCYPPHVCVSEDLPHKSGITTTSSIAPDTPICGRKTCPTNWGLRHGPIFNQGYDFRSEDLPHKSGITTR